MVDTVPGFGGGFPLFANLDPIAQSLLQLAQALNNLDQDVKSTIFKQAIGYLPSAAFSTGQVVVTSNPTIILPSNASRVYAQFYVIGGNIVYLGKSAVASTTGFPIVTARPLVMSGNLSTASIYGTIDPNASPMTETVAYIAW